MGGFMQGVTTRRMAPRCDRRVDRQEVVCAPRENFSCAGTGGGGRRGFLEHPPARSKCGVMLERACSFAPRVLQLTEREMH